MRFAIEHQFDYLLNLDADFSHDPQYIPALLAGMADHDVMIGSRYVPGGGVEGGFTLKRRLMSSGINGYARLMLGLTTRDNSGAVPLLSRQQTGRDRPGPGSLAAAIRSRKRSCSGASRSAASLERRRSCSRTAGPACPRSTCARLLRPSGSSSSSAWREGWAGTHRRTIGARSKVGIVPVRRPHRQSGHDVDRTRSGVR